MSELNRREFVTAVGAAAAGMCAIGSSNQEFLAEQQPAASANQTIDIGVVADYPSDGIKDTWAKPNKFFVVRKGNRLFAPSSVCTHKSCGLKLREGAIACPCHRSKFSDEGAVA